MGQTWRELLFAHWELPPDVVRRVVPPQLPLDLRDGSAWVGVTPFRVTGLRAHGLPPIPGTASFLELNVRTYVVVDDRPGIYFFSLDASSRAAVFAARRGYRLPYFHADISIERNGAAVAYSSTRRSSDGPPASFEAQYGPSGPRLAVVEGSLERWLAERYCLYTIDARGRVLRGDIHHHPWPLQPARAGLAVNRMGDQVGLDLSGEPLLHYSGRQDTVLWALRPVGA
jgi:uncharacterized protein YqjF (DUF2071 family)